MSLGFSSLLKKFLLNYVGSFLSSLLISRVKQLIEDVEKERQDVIGEFLFMKEIKLGHKTLLDSICRKDSSLSSDSFCCSFFIVYSVTFAKTIQE